MLKTILIALNLLGPSFSFAAEVTPPVRAEEDNLTRSFAEFRSSQVKSVHYDLSLIFLKKSTSYEGITTISADLNRVDAPLSIDFAGKTIKKLTVNGTEINSFKVHTGSIEIPADVLKASTRIVIHYVNDFSLTPSGLYRSVDSADQKEYLYTDFEPYKAHQFFPCFDQPDLKASFSVHVNAPAGWKVISNGVPKKGTSDFDFKTPISTYLFFLAAGDYHEFKDHYGKLPLVMYSRQSIAEHVDSKKMFGVIKKGLSFYERFFAQKYPYPKYGQVFIPDFMFGGMENPGAITLNERYLFRGQPTAKQTRDRESVILHEMAHMWFGDLVTMKWWNDLWLNESFASYMEALCSSEVFGSKSAWIDFSSQKAWGYWQDSLVTTHSIEAPVPDVQTATENFDGITYAKGASSLQQLHYFVGPSDFKKGVQAYFRKYKGGNTTRADFIGEIALASGKNLDAWTKAWLQSAGPNRISADWTCSDGKISSFKVKQEPNATGVLSPHKFVVGLISKTEDGAFKVQSTQPVDLETASAEVSYFLKKPCPDFVYTNMGDEDYQFSILDSKSLANAKGALTSLPDPLLRLMIWENLNQMVQDGKLSPVEYLKITTEALKTENDENLLSVVLGPHSSLKENYFEMLTPVQRAKISADFEALIWQRLNSTHEKSALQLSFFDFAVAVSRSPVSRQLLLDLLDERTSFIGVTLDQDRRWAALSSLASIGAPGIQKRIDEEAKVDVSNRGKSLAEAARASIPEAATKEKVWADAFNPGAMDESTFRLIERRFQNPDRPDLEKPFVDSFFKKMSALDWTNPVHHDRVEGYFETFFPKLCSREILQKSEESLKSAHVADFVRRPWLEANEMLGRCVRAQKLVD